MLKPEWLTATFTLGIAVTGVYALHYAQVQIRDVRDQAQVQIREARDEAKVQHLVSLDTEFWNEPLLTYRKLCAQKRQKSIKDPNEEDAQLQFFDKVALLANHGYLADEDVYDRFAYNILSLYGDDKENIDEERKYDQTNYTNLLQLIPRLESIDKDRNGTLAKPTKDDLRDYWQQEAGLATTH
jgi:hypothetical protein